MKVRLLFAFLFLTSSVWAQIPQTAPKDVFLEIDPDAAKSEAPVEDLPPSEPPYTKTPDELEAQQMLNQEASPPVEEPVVEQKNELPRQVEIEETNSDKKKIAHPYSKKGLYLIDQNTGRYYYKTEKISKKNQATSIRIGSMTAPNISVDIGREQPLTFQDIYDTDNLPYLMLDYEWQPFRSFGKLGVVLGLGFFTANGNGRFANPAVQNGDAAKEEFTFIGLPISIGGIYRLEFSDRQWFAPFVVGGGSYYVLGEIRDDGKTPKVVGTPAGYAGGGVLINITRWSKEIDFIMDREYGISNMWLAAEFRTVQSLNEDLDISSDVFNIGISVDY